MRDSQKYLCMSHVHSTPIILTAAQAASATCSSRRSHSMPSCLAARHSVLRTILSPRDLSIKLPALHDSRRAKQSRLFVAGRRRNASCTRAYSASNAQTSNDSLGKKAPSSKHELSALLHRISAFLPRALPGSTTDGGIQSSQLWTELLSEVDAGLCSTPGAHPSARVVGEPSVRLLYVLASDDVTSLQYAELTSGPALMSSLQLSSKIRLQLTRLTVTSYETGGKTSLPTLRSSASCLCSMSQQDA